MNRKQLEALKHLIKVMIDLRVLQLKNGDSPLMRQDVDTAGDELLATFKCNNKKPPVV